MRNREITAVFQVTLLSGVSYVLFSVSGNELDDIHGMKMKMFKQKVCIEENTFTRISSNFV